MNISIETECIERIYLVENVKETNFAFHVDHPKIINQLEKIEGKGEHHYYFSIETCSQDAFGHWVFESAIFFPLYFELKEKYPKLKILLKEQKNYKNLFFNHFGIEGLSYELKLPNTVIFPKFIHLSAIRNEFLSRFPLQEFLSHLLKNCPTLEKDIPILFLPRQSKENCYKNDRVCDYTDIPEHTSMIYNTDTTTVLQDQINLVRRAKTIILDYGSSFSVNGMFAENSRIIVLGIFDHHTKYPLPVKMYQEIKSKNEIFFIQGTPPLPIATARKVPCKFEWKSISHLV